MRATLRQNEAIDIAVLPHGVYLLTLQSGQESSEESGEESGEESSEESGEESGQESGQEQSQVQITRRLVIGF